MNVNDIAKVIAAVPANRALGDESYWRDVTANILPSVIDEVTQAFDWDFSITEDTSQSTVADTAEYTLQGKNKDLRDIVTIRLGTKSSVLQKMRRLDAMDLLENGSNIGSVSAWYQSGVDSSGYPKVVLIDTPTTIETLKVLYRKRDIPIELFPANFQWVLKAGVISYVQPETRIVFMDAIKRMIKRHRVGGKDYNPAQLDPQIVQANRELNDLYGTG